MQSGQKLFLPSGTMSKRFKLGDFEFYAEDGQICWIHLTTGRFMAKTPKEALAIVQDLAKNSVGTGVESSICKDAEDRRELLEFLRRIEELAKEEMARQPDMSPFEQMLRSF